MKVIVPTRALLASAAALFLLVPASVLMTAIFSAEVWWNPPIRDAQVVGGLTLVVIAPLSWLLMMGRPGAWRALVGLLTLSCVGLFLKALSGLNAGQAIAATSFSAFCWVLGSWALREQRRSYFYSGVQWFEGTPQAIPGLRAAISTVDSSQQELSVCRIDSEGLFAVSQSGRLVPWADVDVELRFGVQHEERKIRVRGIVVRQFEGRSWHRNGSDWGIGVRFVSLTPDCKKDLVEFLEVLRGEGYID
ncbi:MAG: hypothetical protein RJB38_1436 [Pseudomonadota bacterium]|jgi:hypothetical protein